MKCYSAQQLQSFALTGVSFIGNSKPGRSLSRVQERTTVRQRDALEHRGVGRIENLSSSTVQRVMALNASASKEVWALDFDGVACDSCGESSLSAWRVRQESLFSFCVVMDEWTGQ